MQSSMSGTFNKPSTAPPADAIITVTPERHREAVTVLLSHQRDGHVGARRFLEYARQNNVSLESMWSLVDGRGAIQATVLGVPSPGQTAMLFSTRPPSIQHADPIARLIDHACKGLRARHVDLAQALLDPGDEIPKSCYLAAGFMLLAQLSYMQRPIRATDSALRADWPDGFVVEPYDTRRRDELVDLLDETYVDTLDCLGLVGLREAKDILTGHESVGDKSAHEWHVLRHDGRAVGVLMLNPSTSADTVELVYLGLAPSARGRSLGAKLLRTGLSRLAKRREQSVTLAVDQQNQPAVSLYEREGFGVVLERVAMIRSLRTM
jgi:mycothiol synthase